jgi:hypothetical protein
MERTNDTCPCLYILNVVKYAYSEVSSNQFANLKLPW